MPAIMVDDDKAKMREYPTALYLFMIIMIFAFVFETVIHLLLFVFPPDVSIQVEAFYDALLLILMLFPTLYFFLYSPLVRCITKCKRVEEEIRENEKRFHLVADSATDAIISVDSLGRITFWNKAAEAIFGYTPEEVVGKPLTMIMPERFREKHTKGMNRVVLTGKSKIIEKTIEVAGLRKNGREFPLELSLAKWRTDEGTFFTGVLRDITERKRAEAELKRANRRMKSDLQVAAMAQKSLLPKESLEIGGVGFASSFKPCEEVGGDIYNVFQLDEKHIGLYMLDVSGHGVPAALLSVTLSRILYPSRGQSSLVKQQVADSPDYRLVPPAEVAKHLNSQFLMDSDNPQYFTLVYGILNLETYEYRYISAGYLSLIYIPHDSDAVILEDPGFPIGCFREAYYEESSLCLGHRDRLYLYSDGVTEAMNSNEKQFGERRLIDALDQSRDLLLEKSVMSLVGRVEDWCGNAKVVDDVSVLAFEIAEKKG
jgi:sigma-B regulation protein RsbU (phosphoserine phosphatase)